MVGTAPAAMVVLLNVALTLPMVTVVTTSVLLLLALVCFTRSVCALLICPARLDQLFEPTWYCPPVTAIVAGPLSPLMVMLAEVMVVLKATLL